MKAQTISLSRNPALDNTPLSVLDSINSHLKRLSSSKKVIPLHQGKTLFTTPVELRHWADSEFDYPPHHDGPPGGTNTLIEAIREKLETQFGQEIDPERIQVTCGITHGLSIIFHCVLLPGDEVIVLSPQWLFAKGLVRASGGVPVEVPFFPATGGEPIGGVTTLIAPYLTAKTRAIYFNSPNNPTGRSLSRTQFEELADFAGERGLYLVADNAYEFYDYTPGGFIDPAMLHDGRHHTFSAYSFSKSFGMTGYRIGYLLSPPDMAELARKFALHSIYSVATPCQFAALSAMRVSPEIVDSHREFIKTALDITNQQLRVPASIPDGGFYTLLDLSAWQRGTDDFIHACVSEGVSLAPGRAFGAGYDQYARLCYSVVSHEDLKEGIRIINDIYERNS
jgi:aspartate aminotransferase/N-succinyldiaminopimelate aminotransferase